MAGWRRAAHAAAAASLADSFAFRRSLDHWSNDHEPSQLPHHSKAALSSPPPRASIRRRLTGTSNTFWASARRLGPVRVPPSLERCTAAAAAAAGAQRLFIAPGAPSLAPGLVVMSWEYSGFAAEKIEAGRRLLASDPAYAGSEELEVSGDVKTAWPGCVSTTP